MNNLENPEWEPEYNDENMKPVYIALAGALLFLLIKTILEWSK
jgi:hypothetical protein